MALLQFMNGPRVCHRTWPLKKLNIMPSTLTKVEHQPREIVVNRGELRRKLDTKVTENKILSPVFQFRSFNFSFIYSGRGSPGTRSGHLLGQVGASFWNQ